MSESIEITLAPNILSILHEMEEVFKQFSIDYYIVGALARDIYIETKKRDKAIRKTNDVDIAVYLNNEEKYNELMEALVATGSFKRDEKEIIKLYHKSGLEVDLIPFGEIENKQREVKLTTPKAFTLQMPGFLETFPFTESVVSGKLTLKTCPVEGLVMLKLISWDDRPQRTHDLTDIENIIEAYFDWNADEIYEQHNDIFDQYDHVATVLWEKLIAAHIIGRKMRLLGAGSPYLLKRVRGILAKRGNPEWKALLNGLNEI